MKNDFELAQIFTDHMVLQQGMSNPVWGKAADGKKVVISFLDQEFETVSSEGKWCIKLSPENAGGPYEMKISCEDNTIIIKDIYIGEVWLAGGQSNMQYSLTDIEAHEDIANAVDERIRYCNIPRIAYEDETTADLKPKWQICSPDCAGDFSAVAYYFAKNLLKDMDVHIGIIGCNYGATSASCWMSEEYIASDEDTKVILDNYYNILNSKTDEEHEKELEEFNKKARETVQAIDEYKKKNPDADQKTINDLFGFGWFFPPMNKKNWMRPCGLYHTMFKKVVPYGIRGVIYYQGESDAIHASIYGKLFGKLIDNWRHDFNNPNLPILFVQLPLFNSIDSVFKKIKSPEWAVVRDQQLLVSKNYKNVEMAVALDCGDPEDIHPRNKKPVGYRLSLLARAKVYGEDIPYSGPVYTSMDIEGNKVILHFDHTDGGLVAKDGELKGFIIAGEDEVFVEAKAEICGNTVVVSSDSVPSPVAVRYAWENNIDAYLYNGVGLPASPFRTDNFEY